MTIAKKNGSYLDALYSGSLFRRSVRGYSPKGVSESDVYYIVKFYTVDLLPNIAECVNLETDEWVNIPVKTLVESLIYDPSNGEYIPTGKHYSIDEIFN